MTKVYCTDKVGLKFVGPGELQWKEHHFTYTFKARLEAKEELDCTNEEWEWYEWTLEPTTGGIPGEIYTFPSGKGAAKWG